MAIVALVLTLADSSQMSSGAGARGIHDPVELERFIDGVMASALRDAHVAVGIVAVVHDGRVVLTKGYGWSDVERRRRVDAAHTLFRLGSITKLFTWIAVMQLV